MIDETKLGPVGQAFMRLSVLACGLTADREWVAAQVDAGDEMGSARRAYVRTMLAFIEGMSHAFRDLLLTANQAKRVALNVPEIAILSEIQFQLDGKGNARHVRRPLRLRDNVRFIVRLLGRLADTPFEPNFGDQGWRSFLQAVAIRNRVTHPRTREDMWVTDENLEEVDRAIKWFEDETGRFLHSFKVPFGVDSPEGAAQQ